MKTPMVHPFQYLSLVRYKGLKYILKNYDSYKISIILDLEDSVQDLFSKKLTNELKKIGRKGLIYLAEKKIKIKNKIYVRINGIDTSDHKKDLEVLKLVENQGLLIEGVFLPKVEKFEEVKKVYDNFSNTNKRIKIVPIIESKIGVKNLENILKKDKNNIISHVHYGHFDYCLDANIWPFPEPYHQEYWKSVGDIIKISNKYNKYFIQTPFPLIKNYSLFWSMIKYMKEKYKLKKIFLSLVNYDKNFILEPKKVKNLRLKKISKNLKNNLIFAKKIYDEYISYKSTKKSFSLSSKRFIPPHQFLMAKLFLKQSKN